MATIFEEEQVASNIPFDIIEIILLRLPVKSLLRFKSVAKPWYSLISGSKFTRSHHHQSVNSGNKNILLGCRYIRSHKVIKSANQRFPDIGSHTVIKLTNQGFGIESLELPILEVKALCWCEGLVLFRTKRDNPSDPEYCLWNPSTRAYTQFSWPNELNTYTLFDSKSYGLCYDASSDDYKVVCIYEKRRGTVYLSSLCYVVYSSKNNSWTEEKNSDHKVAWIIPTEPGLFVNGAVHWIKYKYNFSSGDYRCKIICFEPRDDKIKNVPLPACLDIGSSFELSALKGKLSVSISTIDKSTYNSTMVDIWVMKEYGDCKSWTKLITIQNVPLVRDDVRFNSRFYLKPLCLTKEGNYVLQIWESSIVIYRPKDNEFEEIVWFDKEYYLNHPERYWKFSSIFCWNESLLFPNNNA